MINLLPTRVRNRARYEYWRRLAAVSLFLAAGAFAIGAALLVPAYLNARSERLAASDRQALAESILSDPSLTATGGQADAAEAMRAAAAARVAALRPSALIEALLAVRPSGVRVSQIKYDTAKSSVTVLLIGVAGDRDALLAFKSALAGVPGVASADFPVGDLAASSTLGFGITVKYKPPGTSS